MTEEVSITPNNKWEYKDEPVVIQNGDLSVSITYGLQGMITSDTFLPVQIEITNTGETFNGTAVVTVPDSKENKGVSYEQDVVVKKGMTKTVSIGVPELGDFETFKVSLKKDEQEVLGKEITVNLPYDNSTHKVLVGVLSKQAEALEYFDQVSLEEPYNSTVRTVNFSLDSFPEDADTLNMLSFLIIDQFPTKELSNKQIKAVTKWIDNGGVLILSAGGESQEVLEGFGSEYLSYQTGKTKKVQLTYEQDGNSKSISVESTKFQIKGATSLDGIADGMETWNLEKGKGRVIITSCMLGSYSFTEWNGKQDFAITLLNKTMSEELKQQLKENYITDNFNSNIEEALNSYINIDIPKTSFYIILFAIYILLIGPIGYFLLKKIDRREWIWAVIPITAFVFYFAIFFVNKGSKITNPIGTSITMVDSSSSEWEEKIYVSIMNPNKQSYTIAFQKECQSVMPLRIPYYEWNNGDFYDLDISRYSIKENGEQTTITFHNGKAFSKDVFTMETKESKQNSGFHKNLTITQNGISGTIANETGYPISEAGIIYNGMYVYLGDLEVGETITIQEEDTQMLSNKYAYAMADLFVNKMAVKIKEERAKKHQFRQIYTFFGSNLEMMETGEGYVFGIVEQYDRDYIENSSVEENGKAIFYDSFEQGLEDVGEYYVQNIMENMVFAQNGAIDVWSNQLYGESDEVEFEFDDAYEIQELRCSNLTEEEKYKKNGLSIYAWNYESKRYEEIFRTKKQVEQPELSKYISNHQMRLKFECNDSSSLPIISVTGGEKVVGN